jgi:SAM-dependent methyltransferase
MEESATAVPARYDDFADFYESTVSSSLTAPPDAEVRRLVGPVDGLRLLDLACGHGRFARAFARQGARVVGVDLSGVLLDRARAAEREEPLGIRYVQADVKAPSSTLRQRVGSNHRMLSTYLNALIRHGLMLDEAAEPDFPAAWAAMPPEKDPVPVFLAARCRRR